MGRAVARAFELLEQLLLAFAQIDRGLDHDLAEHVASRVAMELAHALAAQAEAMPGLRAFRDLQAGAPALDRRHLDLAAECRGGQRDRNAAVEIPAVALEQA